MVGKPRSTQVLHLLEREIYTQREREREGGINQRKSVLTTAFFGCCVDVVARDEERIQNKIITNFVRTLQSNKANAITDKKVASESWLR